MQGLGPGMFGRGVWRRGPMGSGMMRDLEGLRGERVGEVFLENMIPHHMAAVTMSQ